MQGGKEGEFLFFMLFYFQKPCVCLLPNDQEKAAVRLAGCRESVSLGRDTVRRGRRGRPAEKNEGS